MKKLIVSEETFKIFRIPEMGTATCISFSTLRFYVNRRILISSRDKYAEHKET